MIFLDANIFLRMFSGGVAPEERARAELAARLFESIREGGIRATTSEVVLHEVCFVLGSKQHHGRRPNEIIPVMIDLLRMPGIVFPMDDKRVYLRAFEIWSSHPVLGFADSVIAARCEAEKYELATFDRHFSRIEGLALWSPDGESATD